MQLTARQLITLALATLFVGTAGATTVYRTVDQHGAVSFSDTPPLQTDIPAEELHIQTTGSRDDAATTERLAAMRETTERMIASRMARERHRAELRKLDAETELSRAAVDAPYRDENYGYYPEPVYVGPYRRHHVDHRPKPPLLRPTPEPRRTSYPASLIRKHYNPQVRRVFE